MVSAGGLRGAYDGAGAEAFLPIATELRRIAGFSDDDLAEMAGAAPQINFTPQEVAGVAAKMAGS